MDDIDLIFSFTNATGTDLLGDEFDVEALRKACEEFQSRPMPARSVTMHSNDYAKLSIAAVKVVADMMPLDSLIVYVDDEVPEGKPEFDRPRKDER